MKNQSSVKEQSQGKHSNFEPIRADLLLSDRPIFHKSELRVCNIKYVYITPYFDTEFQKKIQMTYHVYTKP